MTPERREYLKQYSKNWRKNNNVKAKELAKEYRLKNKLIIREKAKAQTLLLKMRIYNHYSNYDIRCNCCGERHIEFLSLDHINNDGAEHRKDIGVSSLYSWIIKNQFPSNYQILCMNCNCAKGRDKEHLCVHQKEIAEKVINPKIKES